LTFKDAQISLTLMIHNLCTYTSEIFCRHRFQRLMDSVTYVVIMLVCWRFRFRSIRRSPSYYKCKHSKKL